jgi:hypothetical protein
LFEDYFSHLFKDYIYDFRNNGRLILISTAKNSRYFIQVGIMSILPASSTAVPFAQGHDVSRLRAAVDMSAQEIKDYTQEYEDERAIVEALSAAQLAELVNKPEIDILGVRERRLEAARLRETYALALLANCLMADNRAVQAQEAATAATATPAFATTTSLTTTTAEKKIVKRKLPEPRDEWKDSTGKLHRAHSDAMSFHKTLSAMLWELVDIVHQQTNPGTTTPAPDVQLARLVPLAVLEDNISTYSVGQILEMSLNYVHEAAHAVYLKHVHNNTVAEIFLGDELFGADRTVPIEERVNKAVKRVQKLSAVAKAAVGLTGKGGGQSSKRERGRDSYRGGYRHNGGRGNYDQRPRDSYNDMLFSPRGGYNGSQHENFDRGGGSGTGGQRTCFICVSTGHHANHCPKAS